MNITTISDNKLNKFRYNLTIECCEYPLKFLISAHHYSMSIDINPQNNQPFDNFFSKMQIFA